MSRFNDLVELGPIINDWYFKKTSGMVLLHHGQQKEIQGWIEENIKRADIWDGTHSEPVGAAEATAKAADWLLKRFNAVKIEISSDGEGNMTKVKITRHL